MSVVKQNHPPSLIKSEDGPHKVNNAAYDSMFSFFTIPVAKPETPPKGASRQQHQIKEGEKYFLLTPELLKIKQSDAAAKLDIHPSTFSKKWRQSLPDRKWPYRKHCKLERQISKVREQAQMGENVTDHLQELMVLRDQNLSPAVIVVSDLDNMNGGKEANASTAAPPSSLPPAPHTLPSPTKSSTDNNNANNHPQGAHARTPSSAPATSYTPNHTASPSTSGPYAAHLRPDGQYTSNPPSHNTLPNILYPPSDPSPFYNFSITPRSTTPQVPPPPHAPSSTETATAGSPIQGNIPAYSGSHQTSSDTPGQ